MSRGLGDVYKRQIIREGIPYFYTIQKSFMHLHKIFYALTFNGPVHSFTVDRGTEFSGLVSLEAQYGIKTYYCHAYTPAERGSNERFNRNLRYFYPKGTYFEHISAQGLKTTLLEINQRPLKILDWQTPYQVMLTNLSKNSD